MAPGPLAPADGPSAVKAGSGGGAFGSQVDLAAATEGLSLTNGTKAQTLPPVAETPAKDAAVRCRGALGGQWKMAPLLCRRRPAPTTNRSCLIVLPCSCRRLLSRSMRWTSSRQ